MRTARLQPGVSFLIHAGSGTVGQACIGIAQLIGAQIFAAAGSREKRDFLHKTCGIPPKKIYSSRNASFREGMLSMTDGKGVDFIINCLGGDLLQETWYVERLSLKFRLSLTFSKVARCRIRSFHRNRQDRLPRQQPSRHAALLPQRHFQRD